MNDSIIIGIFVFLGVAILLSLITRPRRPH